MGRLVLFEAGVSSSLSKRGEPQTCFWVWVGFLPGLPESQAGESHRLALLSLKGEWLKQKVEADPLRTYREDHTLGRDETQGCIPCPALRGKMRKRREEGKKEGRRRQRKRGLLLEMTGILECSGSGAPTSQPLNHWPVFPSCHPHLSGCENNRP